MRRASTFPVTKRERSSAFAPSMASRAPGTTSRRVKSTMSGSGTAARTSRSVGMRTSPSPREATSARSRSPTELLTPHNRSSIWSCSTTIWSSLVRRRSSSTQSRPERHRSGEGRQGVLPLAEGFTAVGDCRDGQGGSTLPEGVVDAGMPWFPDMQSPPTVRCSPSMVVLGAPEERPGEEQGDNTLQHSGHHQRRLSPQKVAMPPAASAPTGAAPQTIPRAALPTRPIMSCGVRRCRTEFETTAPAPTAIPTSTKAGPARAQLLAEAMTR